MQVITASTVSDALHQGLHVLRGPHVVKQESRVGDVLVSPRPVMTVYENPTNRVLFSPMRDANPFFHVMEALWMLAGRNDLPWLTRFNKRFAEYSDDGGQTQPGAYGYRWRNYFGHDQLQDAILELKQNPKSRRIVIAMWDGGARETWFRKAEEIEFPQLGDSYAAQLGSNDVPCNTHIYFDTIDDRLNMTVCCRSNDIIWGAYGANAVHFSFLLEYICACTGIPMGVYRQFSNNFHLYTNVVPEEQLMPLARDVEATDRYRTRETGMGYKMIMIDPPMRKVPLIAISQEQFEADLYAFMQEGQLGSYDEPFFRFVAAPMALAHHYHKSKEYEMALEAADTIRAEDWRIAATEWLQRRKIKHETNQKRFENVVIDEAADIKPEHFDSLLGVEDHNNETR